MIGNDAMAHNRWAGCKPCIYLGLREGDMIALPRTIARNSQIAIETKKRKIWIDLPVYPDLADAVSFTQLHDAIILCANSRGAHGRRTAVAPPSSR